MILPHLEFKKNVMENDLIRLSAVKTKVNKAEPYPITEINIKVSDQSKVNVFDSREENRFLDVELDFKADITSQNSTLLMFLNNNRFEVDLVEGAYSLEDLLLMIAARVQAVAGLLTTWEVDDYNKLEVKWTTGDKVKFDLRNSPILKNLGFKDTIYRPLVSSTKLESRLVNNLPVGLELEIITEDPENDANQNTKTEKYLLNVYDEKFSLILSNDSELELIEPDILRWVPEGQNTYKVTHLMVVNDLMEWFDRKSYVNIYEEKLVISDFLRPEELNYWAKYQALYHIFNSISNATEDIFMDKAMKYKKLANKSRRRLFKVDLDANNILDFHEVLVSNSIKMVRY